MTEEKLHFEATINDLVSKQNKFALKRKLFYLQRKNDALGLFIFAIVFVQIALALSSIGILLIYYDDDNSFRGYLLDPNNNSFIVLMAILWLSIILPRNLFPYKDHSKNIPFFAVAGYFLMVSLLILIIGKDINATFEAIIATALCWGADNRIKFLHSKKLSIQGDVLEKALIIKYALRELNPPV